MSIRKLILNQAGLPGITKDELKKTVNCHVTAENAAVCVTKVGYVSQHPFHQEDQGEKKKMKKPKQITTDLSDSIFQEFGIVIPIASHEYPSVE